MATLKASRTAQYPLHAYFTFDISAADQMANTSGTTQAFGGASAAYDVIKLPKGARVTGGQVTVNAVSDDTGTATISVGDSGSATRYLGATNMKAAARTALVPTGYTGTGEDLRITIANQNANATVGKVTVEVAFVLDGRANEVVPN